MAIAPRAPENSLAGGYTLNQQVVPTSPTVEERERLVEALSQKLFDEQALGAVMKIVKEGLTRVCERVDAKLAEVDRQLAAVRQRDER